MGNGINQGILAQVTELPINKGQFAAGVSLAGRTTNPQYVPVAAPATTTATSAAAVPGLLASAPFTIQGLQVSYVPQGNAANQTFTVQIYRTPTGSATPVALTNVVIAGLPTNAANTTRAEGSLSLSPADYVSVAAGDLIECTITADVTFSTQITNLVVALK